MFNCCFWFFLEDHAKGLSTFTIMAGLGGFMGYSLGGINWDETAIGNLYIIPTNDIS